MTEEQANLGTVSTEERDKFYEDSGCVPTSCERALGLPRVVWLHKANKAKPFKNVVELGCHDGFSTRWLLNSPHLEKLIGIELSTEAFRHANKLKTEKIFPELGTYYNENIFAFEGGYLDVEPCEHDVVVCFELIEHFVEEDSARLLRLVHSLLTPDGRAFLTTPHIDGPFGKNNPDPAHIHFFDEKRLSEWIEKETGCFATIINVQGILHALWRKDSVPEESAIVIPCDHEEQVRYNQMHGGASLTVEQLRDIKPPTLEELEALPETKAESFIDDSPLTLEQRIAALEEVAHAPVMDHRIAGLIKMVKEEIAHGLKMDEELKALRERLEILEVEGVV